MSAAVCQLFPGPQLTVQYANFATDATIAHEAGAAFTIPSASAVDIVDGDISPSVAVSGTVDEAVVGTYSLTYTVVNSLGATTSHTVTVVVVDSIDGCLGEPCGERSSCFDNVGGFDCVCHDGWSGPTCDNDIDECAGSGATQCGTGYTCVNTLGSFFCRDVDECAVLSEPCGAGYSCVNTDGGFDCFDMYVRAVIPRAGAPVPAACTCARVLTMPLLCVPTCTPLAPPATHTPPCQRRVPLRRRPVQRQRRVQQLGRRVHVHLRVGVCHERGSAGVP